MFFYLFAALLIFSAAMAVVSQHPVRSVLFLVLTFVASAGLWILLQAEFLGLILIVVYVGAVMTLFLFVVMMLNLDKKQSVKRSLIPFISAALIILLMIIFILNAENAGLVHDVGFDGEASNIKQLGLYLFHQHVVAFELSACLLFVAVITAIYLTHRAPQAAKKQIIAEQIAVKREDRIQLVKGDQP
jgi:NADH-quinone oxidoreductase subunit J